MTQPNLEKDQQAPAEPSRPRFRVGQLVTFRHPDPYHPQGKDLTGHALVLKVAGDAVTLAPLGLLHLQTSADNLAPAKPEDVPTTIQQPEPDPNA